MGKQTWIHHPNNGILTQKQQKISQCGTKFALLGHWRVKPYLIAEWQIFLIYVWTALNVIFGFFFHHRLCSFTEYCWFSVYNTKFSVKFFPWSKLCRHRFFIWIHLSQWLWDHLQSKRHNRWQVITLFLFQLKRGMFMSVQGPHSIG